jgi:hypothetical protein
MLRWRGHNLFNSGGRQEVCQIYTFGEARPSGPGAAPGATRRRRRLNGLFFCPRFVGKKGKELPSYAARRAGRCSAGRDSRKVTGHLLRLRGLRAGDQIHSLRATAAAAPPVSLFKCKSGRVHAHTWLLKAPKIHQMTPLRSDNMRCDTGEENASENGRAIVRRRNS